MKKSPLIILAIISIIAAAVVAKNLVFRYFFSPTKSPIPTGIRVRETVNNISPKAGKDIETIAENLKIPWELVFLPDGEMLVTERPGNLLKISGDKKVIKVEGVYHIGEGGLLGMALDPKFSENNYIYLYSTSNENGQISNRVDRYVYRGEILDERKTILTGIKGSQYHDGGRLKFGPDGYLYVTTGDAENPNLAQDKNSLNGKILRIDTSGNPVSDNPFSNAVYSLGHRNVQGIAWDDKGRLWATEHGPSGTQTGNDEINLIVKGNNYGWPLIKGLQKKEGLITPIAESTRRDTWAPSGMIFYRDSLFFAGLRGEALYQAKLISSDKVDLIAHFKKEFGRLRSITLGPDGYFYIMTNNTDGRGSPKPGDDKIIKLNPQLFF